MQHEYSIEAQDRLWVLLEVNQMAFLHELALYAQELSCFLIEGTGGKAMDNKLHVDIFAADESFECTPVVCPQMLQEELLVVLLDLLTSFLFSLVHAYV